MRWVEFRNVCVCEDWTLRLNSTNWKSHDKHQIEQKLNWILDICICGLLLTVLNYNCDYGCCYSYCYCYFVPIFDTDVCFGWNVFAGQCYWCRCWMWLSLFGLMHHLFAVDSDYFYLIQAIFFPLMYLMSWACFPFRFFGGSSVVVFKLILNRIYGVVFYLPLFFIQALEYVSDWFYNLTRFYFYILFRFFFFSCCSVVGDRLCVGQQLNTFLTKCLLTFALKMGNTEVKWKINKK